ncbi:DUF58 domain-containing protein [Thermococcus gammatolerans]|uniref:MoxR associated protein, containing DUF58 domain n=1 Tax=Thermococcus gammatolerans (strain DSM 15229 / JCM 11827 / EJ3) TaxID=593117 RepID=C5A708_THEGJ|nr:DUF58 domain-containing protein [Thermococcus gammatolerans]ACS34020.1 MoxR associated protein, containing DUF58 domain [Thermococcus gammatolerans EJ3]
MRRMDVLLFATLAPFSLALFTGVLGLAYASLIPASILAYSLMSDPPSGFHVERTVEARNLAVGRRARVRVKLTVERGAGLVFIGDVVSPGLKVHGRNRRVFVKLPGEVLQVEYSYEVSPGKRGVHSISPVEVISQDFLGILRKNYGIFGDEVTIEARPVIGSLRASSLRSIRAKRRGLPVVLSRKGISSKDFKEIREYQPGDPLKAINWKATARFGVPLVNEYEPEGMATVMVYADTTTDMGTGDVFNGALESALGLSLSLVHTLLKANLRVGLYLAGSKRFVTPRTGTQAFSSFLRAVLSAGPSPNPEPMPLAVERSKRAGKVDLAIIITNITPYNVSELRDAIGKLRKTFNCRVLLVDVNPYGAIDKEVMQLSRLHKRKLAGKLGVPVVEWVPSREGPSTALKKILGGVSLAL